MLWYFLIACLVLGLNMTKMTFKWELPWLIFVVYKNHHSQQHQHHLQQCCKSHPRTTGCQLGCWAFQSFDFPYQRSNRTSRPDCKEWTQLGVFHWWAEKLFCNHSNKVKAPVLAMRVQTCLFSSQTNCTQTTSHKTKPLYTVTKRPVVCHEPSQLYLFLQE